MRTIVQLHVFPASYFNVDMLMQILARSRKRLRRCILEIPQFVLHTTVEFVRVALPLQMELYTDGGILLKIPHFVNDYDALALCFTAEHVRAYNIHKYSFQWLRTTPTEK